MAQDRRVHALVYFCSAVGDLLGVVLYWHLDLEFTDMKQEDIIRMAREAGLVGGPVYAKGLVAFAALVAAAERERIIKVIESMGTWAHINEVIDEVRKNT
jgi:hypothetical protein